MLRMVRFMDYLVIMFRDIYTDRTCKISTACSNAYMTALSPYHEFLVKTVAKAAMHAAPGRDKILWYIKNSKNHEEVYKIMQEFVENLIPVKEGIWKFYRENKLDSLP